MDEIILVLMDEIAEAVREAGYDPYVQLTGYIRTGNDRYITRTSNARERIRQIDRKDLKQYIGRIKPKE